MTYTTPHYYVTWGGELGTVETWQTGCRFAPIPGNPSNSVGTLLGALENISISDILADVTAVIVGAGPVYNSLVKMSWAKIAVIDVDGTYAGEPKAAEQPPVGGSGSEALPFLQLAWCVSLWSGESLGRANHGRMYWPCPSQIQVHPNTGQIDPLSTVLQFQNKVRTAIHNVNGEVATVAVDVRPSIMSKLGTGTTKTITKVAAGPVMDTMRSRRESLDDTIISWVPGW